jgi:hypothetical protein
MSIALLDINDCNLQLWHSGSHLQSPGYALLAGGQYRFGNPARAAARLQPRDINTRYWWQLSTEPLQPALGPARHTGDLVHAQLQELHREGGKPDEILVAVSGSMQRDQLALLLGIAQQCPFSAVGLVNRSVALGSLHATGARLFHLEVQLHQAVITELANRDGRVELQRTLPLPGCGLLQLQEKLVEIIAAGFIRQTRFDPRRKAATEQQLYDALPDALRALGQSGETNLEVNGYRARVVRGELLEAGHRLFTGMTEAMGTLQPGDRIIADPVAGLLPGLTEQLPRLELLAADSVRQALHQHLDLLVQREQALSFVTALPSLVDAEEPEAPATVQAPAEQSPAEPVRLPPANHLLQGHTARPLASAGTALEQGWEIHRSGPGWQLRGGAGEALVNGKPYQPGQHLGAGDSISIAGGQSLVLIEVSS